MADSHPADDLIASIKGLFDGSNMKQAVREAWDRVNGKQPPPQVNPMTKQANDAAVQRANKEFLDADAAARIRAKVAGK